MMPTSSQAKGRVYGAYQGLEAETKWKGASICSSAKWLRIQYIAVPLNVATFLRRYHHLECVLITKFSQSETVFFSR